MTSAGFPVRRDVGADLALLAQVPHGQAVLTAMAVQGFEKSQSFDTVASRLGLTETEVVGVCLHLAWRDFIRIPRQRPAGASMADPHLTGRGRHVLEHVAQQRALLSSAGVEVLHHLAAARQGATLQQLHDTQALLWRRPVDRGGNTRRTEEAPMPSAASLTPGVLRSGPRKPLGRASEVGGRPTRIRPDRSRKAVSRASNLLEDAGFIGPSDASDGYCLTAEGRLILEAAQEVARSKGTRPGTTGSDILLLLGAELDTLRIKAKTGLGIEDIQADNATTKESQLDLLVGAGLVARAAGPEERYEVTDGAHTLLRACDNLLYRMGSAAGVARHNGAMVQTRGVDVPGVKLVAARRRQSRSLAGPAPHHHSSDGATGRPML